MFNNFSKLYSNMNNSFFITSLSITTKSDSTLLVQKTLSFKSEPVNHLIVEKSNFAMCSIINAWKKFLLCVRQFAWIQPYEIKDKINKGKY